MGTARYVEFDRLLEERLLVAMHHSGLFARWRRHIATGVSWYRDCADGELTGTAGRRAPRARDPRGVHPLPRDRP